MNASEGTDKKLKLVNLIRLNDSVTGQENNAEKQNNKLKLISKYNVYITYKKVRKRKKKYFIRRF